MTNTEFISAFEPMLAALDEAFIFLVDDYGFEKTQPEQCGRELSVTYRRFSVVAFTISSEFFSTPYISVSARMAGSEKNLSHAPLHLLAKKRNPDWVRPSIEKGAATASSLQAFFESYATLIKETFPDLLTLELIDGSAEPEGQVADAVSSTGEARDANVGKAARLQGLAIAVIAFCVIVFEMRYFTSNGLPGATYSTRANWGILLLIGLPWAALFAGFLQFIGGVSVRRYGQEFDAMPLSVRAGVALGALALASVAAGLAISMA